MPLSFQIRTKQLSEHQWHWEQQIYEAVDLLRKDGVDAEYVKTIVTSACDCPGYIHIPFKR